MIRLSRRRPLRLLSLFVALATLAAACGGGGDGGAAPASDGDGALTITPEDPDAGPRVGPDDESDDPPAPEIEFTYFDGTDGTLDDFAGQPLVVNFWASWCAPCVAEMPEFQAVFEEVGTEVPFLGFNVADDPDDADALVETTGVTYELARDETQAIFQAFRGFAMPTTVLIDENGRLAVRWAGPLTGEQLREMIAEEFGV